MWEKQNDKKKQKITSISQVALLTSTRVFSVCAFVSKPSHFTSCSFHFWREGTKKKGFNSLKPKHKFLVVQSILIGNMDKQHHYTKKYSQQYLKLPLLRERVFLQISSKHLCIISSTIQVNVAQNPQTETRAFL